MTAGRKSISDRLSNRRSSIQPSDLYSETTPVEQKPGPVTKPKQQPKKPTAVPDDKEPFSSSLRPSRKRKLKLYALALGKKDNEILEQALDEFFEKYKDDAQL